MWEWTIMLMPTSNGKFFIESLQKKKYHPSVRPRIKIYGGKTWPQQ